MGHLEDIDQIKRVRTLVMEILQVREEEIENILNIKKGMTNHSFLVKCRGKQYIMRVPGEGTDRLVNRAQEAEVYRGIAKKGICQENLYLNAENGIKFSRYITEAHTCDPFCREEVKKCMRKLRSFHEMNLVVEHEFNIFNQIAFYEGLWGGHKTRYEDYPQTKENIFSLRKFINQNVGQKVLSHIDAVPDNFIFFVNSDGKEEIQLLDWEYAGMHDPHADIAMFGIYAMYDRRQMDELIQDYFYEGCSLKIRAKIYCYIAAGGLLWSNWCEYKRMLGMEFGAYAARQYEYAKEYYQAAADLIANNKESMGNTHRGISGR